MMLQQRRHKSKGLWNLIPRPLAYTENTSKRKDDFMKLNIYKGKEVVKTYEVDNYDLTYGVIEDVIEIIDGKDLENKNDLINVAIDSFHLLRPLLKEVFNGLTDDELRTVKVRELIVVIVELIKASISNLKKITGDDVKNVIADSLR